MLIIKWVFLAISIMFIAWIIPGIEISNFATALITAIVMGITNLVIRPIILILTLPITILTLGLFALVINAAMFSFASYVVPGFEVESFWAALFGSIIFSIISTSINRID